MKTNLNFQILKRATTTVALFFIIQVQAAPSTETYRDIIEKAQNLSLQKDRTQAVAILLGALKKESKKSTAQRELAASIDQVSKIFYSDKAQQLYELGLSLRASDPNLALSKLQEASRLEPDNMSIEIALARQSLSTSDCDGALNRILKRKELFPAVEDLKLIAAQAFICLGKFDDYLSLRNALDSKNSNLMLFWQMAEIEYHFKTKTAPKSLETIQNAQKTDPNFPEAYYWSWKVLAETKTNAEKPAQKYLNLCKTLNSRRQRQYLPEPQLCRRTPEVESFLKKNNNSEI